MKLTDLNNVGISVSVSLFLLPDHFFRNHFRSQEGPEGDRHELLAGEAVIVTCHTNQLKMRYSTSFWSTRPLETSSWVGIFEILIIFGGTFGFF